MWCFFDTCCFFQPEFAHILISQAAVNFIHSKETIWIFCYKFHSRQGRWRAQTGREEEQHTVTPQVENIQNRLNTRILITCSGSSPSTGTPFTSTSLSPAYNNPIGKKGWKLPQKHFNIALFPKIISEHLPSKAITLINLETDL